MDTSQFLQPYGIAESALSPAVKDGINEVLRAATMKGLEQLGKIMNEEAAKRGVKLGTPGSTEQQDAAVQAAAEEFDRQQQAERDAAQKKRIILIVLSTLAALALGAGVLIWLKRRKS